MVITNAAASEIIVGGSILTLLFRLCCIASPKCQPLMEAAQPMSSLVGASPTLPPDSTAPAIHSQPPVWNWSALITFRFVATYLVLYTFPRALWVLPYTDGLNGLWNRWVVGGIWAPAA